MKHGCQTLKQHHKKVHLFFVLNTFIFFLFLAENKEIYNYANERLKENDWISLCNKYETVRSDILHYLPGLNEHPTWNYIFDFYYTSNSHKLKVPTEVCIIMFIMIILNSKI